MKWLKLDIILICLILGAYLSFFAQLTGYNTTEYQYGNIPGLEPNDQSSLYNQLNLKCRNKKLSVFTKLEGYQPSFGEDNRR